MKLNRDFFTFAGKISMLVITILSLLSVQIFSNDGLWEKLSSDGPSPRINSTLTWDGERQNLILFGGRFENGGKAGDTWIWSDGNWTRLLVSGPQSRDRHTMVYDEQNQLLLLFGGQDFDSAMNDTWTWNGAKWNRLEVEGPPGRYGHSMAHRQKRHEQRLDTMPSC